MKIERVEVLRIREPEWPRVAWWASSAMDALYDEGRKLREQQVGIYNSLLQSRRDATFMVIVRVVGADGTYGLGCIGLGSEAVASFVESQLAPLVIGSSAFDLELLWEKMYRATINVGRKGLALEAISGIDIALWDLLGKHLRQPVYNLLGGRTRSKIRAYASAGYALDDADDMARRARRHVEDGFTAVKMRFGFGPLDGRAGVKRNIEQVRRIREAIGDDVDLMADAYMGWNATYAIEMLDAVAEYRLTWIEEPVLPDDYAGYARIRARSRVPVAGGEHEFTRWGFRQLIEQGCVDYVQLDVNRCGGITEARKIWALAQAFDLPVVPHSHNFHNLHLILANLNSPIAEYFATGVRDGDSFFSELFVGEPVANAGYLELSDRPGLGVELDEAVVRAHLIERSRS
jgi:L-alanine-DL-glutamate epimerase-like enolase superfamily enzyme